MKCIRLNINKQPFSLWCVGQVIRVDNRTADKAVSEGAAVYVPKSVWKQEVRDVSK